MKSKESVTQEIYRLADELGLQNDEVDSIINKSSEEQIYLSLGPPVYPGAHYGAVSIYDF